MGLVFHIASHCPRRVARGTFCHTYSPGSSNPCRDDSNISLYSQLQPPYICHRGRPTRDRAPLFVRLDSTRAWIALNFHPNSSEL
jgi:hypothetical protein